MLPTILLALPLLLGCGGLEEEQPLGVAEQSVTTTNAITANAITANAITANAITANALTSHALTANALTANALTANALTDPLARELLKYVVSCALPAGAEINLTISGITYTFNGQLGLAKDWGVDGGSCGGSCTRWVSGCVLSRINYLGVSVPLSIRGPNSKLSASSNEINTYGNREATYYGDIFAVPQIRYACLPPERTQIPRVCGPSTAGCVVSVIGPCDVVCEAPTSIGAYQQCHDAMPVNGGFPGPIRVYDGDVTVFLQ